MSFVSNYRNTVVPLIFLPYLLLGCSSSQEKASELKVAFTNDSANLNPFHPNFFTIGRFLSGALMRCDSNGQEWHPLVASAVEWKADSPEIVITINPKHCFADGSAIQPSDVAASINAHGDPKIGSLPSAVLRSSGFIEAETIGDNQVRVRFKEHWVPALNLIRQLSIWPEALVNKVRRLKGDVKLTLDELVGAGTHRLTEYVPNGYAVLTPVFGGSVIRIKIIRDDNGVLTQFEEGEVDLAYAEPRRQSGFARIPGARVMTYPDPQVVTLAFNLETVKSRSVREALSRATLPETYRLLVAKDSSERAEGRLFCGPENAWNAPDASALLSAFDLEQANRLLETEYPLQHGRRPLTITLITYDSSEYRILVERLAADWKMTLGIEVRWHVLKSSQFNDVVYRRSADIKAWDWDAIIAEWPYQLVDFEPSRADSLLDSCIPVDGRAGRNIIGWRDTGERGEKMFLSVSDLVRRADTEVDQELRKKIYHNIHRRMLNERVVLPLYIVRDSWVVSDRVKGFSPTEPYMKHFIFRWADKLQLKR